MGTAVSAAREAAVGPQRSGTELPLPVLLSEADLRASLCLVHHASGDANAGDQAKAEMFALQRRASEKARVEQQPVVQVQQKPTPQASFYQEQPVVQVQQQPTPQASFYQEQFTA